MSGHYQHFLAACAINDPQEEEKVACLAKEFERLYILAKMNGVWNTLPGNMASLNRDLPGVPIENYRGVFDRLLLETIRRRKLRGDREVGLLEYSTFSRLSYDDLDTVVLRYILARVEEFLCAQLDVEMLADVRTISKRRMSKTKQFHVEHILSHNAENAGLFAKPEDFENKRNGIGGLLLLKGSDNMSSGNERYAS